MPAVVTVVVPWRGGCPHREAALTWLVRRIEARHTGWRVAVGLSGHSTGPWVKALAVADAAPRDGIVVVSDADVWCRETAAAVDAVAGGAPWAAPHSRVHRLSPAATVEVLAGEEPAMRMPLVQRPYRATLGGGIVVVPAATLARVPMDPRFVGWGGEDEAWGLALTCLAGEAWRGDGVLWHLHHPAQPRLSRRVGSEESAALVARYRAAHRDGPAATRALLAEAAA